MPVIRKELKTMQEAYVCDKCGRGVLIPTDEWQLVTDLKKPIQLIDGMLIRIGKKRIVRLKLLDSVSPAEVTQSESALLESPRCEPQ